ncbi:hypothetical protein F2Q68_00025256 [Brassica cretica]|uniref:Uncharacterized protein n=2 Tax=Brassica cretica TaxID=69181 RepID=A0A8S9I7I8_BRACR|nr:hypothetical protein F2Q68_00025256 [Brassica cretica]KAF3578949.1 hypothetical protein DY000_02030889 [Brassica cretica]
MSSSVSLVSLKNIHNLVLPIGTLSISIGSAASSEGVLTAYGGLSEGLGYGLSALRRATSIFGICTQMSIDLDVNRAGRMWVFCCELLYQAQGLQPPERLSSDLLHYADDPPGHTGLPYHHVQESRSQPCLAAQYRSMFGLKCRSISDGRCRSMEECLRSTVESECGSTRLVSGSTVVDEN